MRIGKVAPLFDNRKYLPIYDVNQNVDVQLCDILSAVMH